jgi:CheY-like chemotaxis protein
MLACKSAPALHEPSSAAPEPRAQTPMRILLVEDHQATSRVLTRLLRHAGHTVHSADTIASACGLADHHSFDLLISDLGLPDGDGTDLLRYMSARSPLLAIAISGYGMPEDIARSRAAGFLEHLLKPVSADQLDAALARAGALLTNAPVTM